MGKKKALYIDMDGTLARFHDADKAFIEAMWTPGFYVNLKPFENICEAVRQFIKHNPDVDVYVLSAVLDTEPPFVVDEKNVWLDNHLPEIDKEHRIFTRAGEDKSQYIDMESCECFLLDDYNKNLYEFEAAGGVSIKFHNDVNHKGLGEFGGSKGKLWEGAIVHYDKVPELTCLQLEGYLGKIKGFEDFVIVDDVLVEYTGQNETVVIPEGIREVEMNAFANNQYVKHVEFPSSLETIKPGAFAGVDLQELNLPENLRTISYNAFVGCKSLLKVDVPGSVRHLHVSAFSDCDNLKEINFNSIYSDYSSENGILYSSDGFEESVCLCPAGFQGSFKTSDNIYGVGFEAFKGCTGLINIELNDGLNIIGASAFSDCSALKSIVVPSSVAHLLDNAFENCSNLESIVLSNELSELGHGVFDGCKKLSEIVVSDEALVRYCEQFNLLDEVFMTPCFEGLKARYEELVKGKVVDGLIEDASQRCSEQVVEGKSNEKEFE